MWKQVPKFLNSLNNYFGNSPNLFFQKLHCIFTNKTLNHTSGVAVVTPTDRPKLVCNPCVIELFCGLFVLSLCPFDISVGIGAFVIGLSHISSFSLKWWLLIEIVIKHASVYLKIYNFWNFTDFWLGYIEEKVVAFEVFWHFLWNLTQC